jgi:hypothetical protein
MITPEDLRAAVQRGIVTEAQSAQLIALAAARQTAKDGFEEPFVLFKGFNEIFVVVGLVILFTGWVGVATLLGLDMDAPAGVTTILLSGVTIAGLAGVGRYFTTKRRMVAPSIALSIMTALTAVVLGFALVGSPFGTYSVAAVSLFVAVLMAGHYWMFRIPFSAAIIAGAAYYALFSTWSVRGFEGLVFGAGGEEMSLIVMTIAFGLAVFALAMRLDMSDPLRVSTRSATAFWLHVTAAPAIVNTVALRLLADGSAAAQAGLLAFLLLIAVVAVVIDRRSFLISGAGYSVALAATLFEGGAAVAILILGLALVLLGAGWDRLRARLMTALPDFPGKDRLPAYGVTE